MMTNIPSSKFTQMKNIKIKTIQWYEIYSEMNKKESPLGIKSVETEKTHICIFYNDKYGNY